MRGINFDSAGTNTVEWWEQEEDGRARWNAIAQQQQMTPPEPIKHAWKEGLKVKTGTVWGIAIAETVLPGAYLQSENCMNYGCNASIDSVECVGVRLRYNEKRKPMYGPCVDIPADEFWAMTPDERKLKYMEVAIALSPDNLSAKEQEALETLKALLRKG